MSTHSNVQAANVTSTKIPEMSSQSIVRLDTISNNTVNKSNREAMKNEIIAISENKMRNQLKHRSKFTCRQCFRSFNDLWHRERHEVTHTTERPYACLNCPKTFTRKDKLKSHKCNSNIYVRQKKLKSDNSKKFEPAATVPCKMSVSKTHENHLASTPGDNGDYIKVSVKSKRAKSLSVRIPKAVQSRMQCISCTKTFTSSNMLKRHELSHKVGTVSFVSNPMEKVEEEKEEVINLDSSEDESRTDVDIIYINDEHVKEGVDDDGLLIMDCEVICEDQPGDDKLVDDIYN